MPLDNTVLERPEAPARKRVLLEYDLVPAIDYTRIAEQNLPSKRERTSPGYGSYSGILSLVGTPTRAQGEASVNLTRYLSSGPEQVLLKLVSQQLEDGREDAARENEPEPTQATIQGCLRLAEIVARLVADRSEVRCGAFVESDGKTSLVLQSLSTDRRINYLVSRNGRYVTVLGIDEDMKSRSLSASLSQTKLLQEWAEWVVLRR